MYIKMKRLFVVIILLAFTMPAFIGCKSETVEKTKEEKAAELIKQELSKTLYDFDSYQPIETKVKEAKANRFNDSTCWNKAGVLVYSMHQVDEYIAQAKEATEYMAIYQPTRYSSSYSVNKFYDYDKQYKEAIEKADGWIEACKVLAEELKDTVTNMDTSQVIGWEVIHDFRCKTKGGTPDIVHFRYVISKDFKSVILREDMGGMIDKRIREVLETIETAW